MLRYLHMTAKRFTEGLAVKMPQHGNYALIPPTHDGNLRQSELMIPQDPHSKRFLETWHRICVVLENTTSF